MQLTGAEILVEGLKSAGVEVVFGVSGSAMLSALDVLYRTPEIRYIQAQHEQAAMYMANGYARQARRAGICFVSPGPGETNVATGAAQAFYTSTPTVIIAAQESSKDLGLGASIHHDLDATAVFAPITRLALRVERADRLQESLRRVFATALAGAQGPCFIGIPNDLLKMTVDVASPDLRLSPVHPPRGNPQDIETVATLLEKARRPLILAGGGVNWAGAHDELRQLVELLNMPAGATKGHNGLFPADHPLSLGALSPGCPPPARQAFQEADLILGIGCTFAYFTGGGLRMSLPTNARIAHVDIDPTVVGKILPTEAAVIGDAKLALQDLLQVLKERGNAARLAEERSGWIAELTRRKAAWAARLAPLLASDAVPIRNYRLMGDLRKALARETIVGADAGATRQWFDHAFPGLAPCTIGGWHPMGAELCEAMGVKVAAPETPVAVFMGDGSLMMSLQELATAVANDIRILVVVLHNGVFGNMRHQQIAEFGRRFIGTDLPIPNLSNIAREFGAYGERVEQPTEIIPAVRRALESGKPALLEFMVDASDDNLVPPKA